MAETTVGSFAALIRSADDPKTSRWKGPALPFYERPAGAFGSKGTRDVIWSSIVNILLTPIGTRIRKPEFGSRVPELVFEPNDTILQSLARAYVFDALRKWEPRIILNSAECFRPRDNEHALIIRLGYTIRDDNIEERRALRITQNAASMERIT